MVYQGMPNGGMPYAGQPVYVLPPRGRGRGRGSTGDGGNQNLVTRVKAELQVARPGQVLELTRFAASQLASRSPVLYQQFLAGLGVGDQPVKAETEEKVTRNFIVADRKARWRDACLLDLDVQYWQQLQDRIKEERGANAEVDAIVTDDESLDIRQYLRGKKRREELLMENGLAREGSTLVPLEGDDTDSQAGGQPLTSSNAGKKGGGGNPSDISGIMNLLTLLVAKQSGQGGASMSSSSNSSGLGAEGKKDGPVKAPNPPPSKT